VSEVGAAWRHADIPFDGGSQMISPTRRALLLACLMLAVLLSGCAQAEPRVPIAGSPRWPKMKSQFATMLMMFAVTRANVTGFTRPIACR